MSDMNESETTQDMPAAESTAAAADAIPPALEAMMASIRSAVTHGASEEARAAGAIACRSILSVLDTKSGQPLPAAPSPATAQKSPFAALLSQPGLLSRLAAMSREELLDLLKQVTGAIPARSQAPSSAPRFHLIQIPQVRRPDGSP
jgi:hypothetical protein